MQHPSFAILAITTVLAYGIGGLPFGYWFVRLTAGRDIRTMGSGNIGATNVYRSIGGKAGWIVLLLDVMKGFVAVWIAAAMTQADEAALALAAVAVMLGHCYPIFLRFKGGKAVACFVGAFGYVAPFALAIAIAAFVIVFALSRYVSLGSMFAAVVFPIAVWLTPGSSSAVRIAAIAAAVLIVYRHKGNILRLRQGREPAFSLKGKTAG